MSREGTGGAGTPRDPRVEDRVVELLSARPGAIAFNGLRRSLNVHPESLTRALRRLERYGLVAKEPSGYRLAGDSPDRIPGRPQPPDHPPRWTGVAEVQLAPGFEGPQILGLLAGRWAGKLRWVGVLERPGEPLLVWSRTDGPGHVLLGMRLGRLKVYAEPGDPGDAPEESLNQSARDLLLFALERIRAVTSLPEPPGIAALLAAQRPVGFGPN
ncbi:MAG: helix-turn-helix transcriptional regulator [Thermoplasmata archaeon]